MGWTKHADAILAHKGRLTEVRAELKQLVGTLNSRKHYSRAFRLLREHESLCSALSYGKHDGTVKSELGIVVNYKHKNMGPIVYELIEEGPDSFTFRRRR